MSWLADIPLWLRIAALVVLLLPHILVLCVARGIVPERFPELPPEEVNRDRTRWQIRATMGLLMWLSIAMLVLHTAGTTSLYLAIAAVFLIASHLFRPRHALLGKRVRLESRRAREGSGAADEIESDRNQ